MYCVDTDKLRGKIVEKGFNISSFADEIGVSRNTMARYLQNPQLIPYDKLSEMATRLCDNAQEAVLIFFSTAYVKSKNGTRKGDNDERNQNF